MGTLFSLLTVVSIFLLIIGIFSPKTSLFWYKQERTRMKSTLIYGISMIVFVALFGKTSDNKNTNANSKGETQTEVTQEQINTKEHKQVSESEQETSEPAKEKKEAETSIGKEITVGHFSYIITGIKFKKTVGGEFGTETADGIYLLVDLTIKNVSDETRTLDGSCFYLTDLNDVKFEFSINGSTALEMSGMKSLFLKECQPRIKTKGVLIFEVPEKDEYYLHLAGNFMGSSSVKILLK